MAIKIKKNGKIEQFTLHSTDVKVLDLEGKFKKKDLESVIREISDTEHIHIGEVDTTKDGVWIDDGEILDNSKNNGVVERLKTFVNETIGELSSLTTSIKSNLVGAINELKGNVDQLSNPNLLINGDFQVWQRGESIVCSGGIRYTSDRWRNHYQPAIYEKITCNDVNIPCSNAIKITSTNTDIGSYCILNQPLEEEIINTLNNKMVTLSFYAKCHKDTLYIAAGGGTYNTNQNFLLSTNWQKFTYTFKVSDSVNGIGFASSLITDITQGYSITGIKLELGSVATPFIPRPYAEELALCRRYFQQVNQSQYYNTFGYGVVTGSQEVLILMPINTPLRVTPTITVTRKDDTESFVVQAYNSVNGISQNYLIDNIYIDGNLVTTNSITLRLTIKGNISIGNVARLCNGNVATTVTLDAEIY